MIKSAVFLLALIVLSQGLAFCQQIIDLTDEEKISLAIDYIRKGIQQENADYIVKIFKDDQADGDKMSTKAKLRSELEKIFAQTEKRVISIPQPQQIIKGSPLASSKLWDFDIINPSIAIAGDTAVVKCQFVLWGDQNKDGSLGRHSDVTLTFVLTIKKSQHLDESGDLRVNPELQSIDGGETGFNYWRLLNANSIIGFFNSSTTKSD